MAREIVSNTGPMISLERLAHGFEFIRKLYDKIIIPEAVLRELAENKFTVHADYLKYYSIDDLVEVKPVLQLSAIPNLNRLDEGEKQAISLADQLGLSLLIEETMGRQIASAAGLHISGIAGQILKAFNDGLIPKVEVEQKLRELHNRGRINRKLLNAMLASLK